MPKRKADAVAAEEPGTSSEEAVLSNVVYIGHVPHGFYEKQMKEYFAQFGKVSKVRLSRNKKSGKSKHYAFLEFSSPDVAKVVADAMDGYMFFGQKLQSRVMNKSEVHPELFKGANRVFKRIPWKKIEMERHNKDITPELAAKRAASAAKREKSRKKRIKEAGIDYEFPGEAVQHEEEAEPTPKPEKKTAKKVKKAVAASAVKAVAPTPAAEGRVTRSRVPTAVEEKDVGTTPAAANTKTSAKTPAKSAAKAPAKTPAAKAPAAAKSAVKKKAAAAAVEEPAVATEGKKRKAAAASAAKPTKKRA